MNYLITNLVGALPWAETFTLMNSEKKLLFISKYNYEILKVYDVLENCGLSEFSYALFIYREKLVLTDLKKFHLEIDPTGMKVIPHRSSSFPIYEKQGNKIEFCPEKQQFVAKVNNKLVNTFSIHSKIWFTNYLNTFIEYTNYQREGSYIFCTDLFTGNVTWRIDFTWEIGSLQIHKKIILFVYKSYDKFKTNKGYEGERNWDNPNRFLIALDIETGAEIWRREHGYQVIDHDHEVLITARVNDIKGGLIKSLSALEIDIYTGETLSDVEVLPVIDSGFYLASVDEHGFFYRTRKGPFGKICKTTGKILWEYDLIDDQGDKRSIVDMTQLGNGSLLLRAVPNHPNGELSCIFDPEENMEYSRVKNGERLPES